MLKSLMKIEGNPPPSKRNAETPNAAEQKAMLKSYKIPRLKRANDQMLLEVKRGSNEYLSAVSEIQQKCEPSTVFNFDDGEFVSMSTILNPQTSQRFNQYASTLKKAQNGPVRRDKVFAVSTTFNAAKVIAKKGLSLHYVDQSKFSHYLGNPECGVHLFTDPIAAIVFQLSIKPIRTMELIVFRIVICNGRKTALQPRKLGRFMEPQPVYDHHIYGGSAPSDGTLACPSGNRKDLPKYYYLYEYNEECDVETFPSSILPIAVLTYKLHNLQKCMMELSKNKVANKNATKVKTNGTKRSFETKTDDFKCPVPKKPYGSLQALIKLQKTAVYDSHQNADTVQGPISTKMLDDCCLKGKADHSFQTTRGSEKQLRQMMCQSSNANGGDQLEWQGHLKLSEMFSVSNEKIEEDNDPER
ncbi:hypothetical protein ACOME3_007877 [Neoechinorhynchus agilis]